MLRKWLRRWLGIEYISDDIFLMNNSIDFVREDMQVLREDVESLLPPATPGSAAPTSRTLVKEMKENLKP